MKKSMLVLTAAICLTSCAGRAVVKDNNSKNNSAGTAPVEPVVVKKKAETAKLDLSQLSRKSVGYGQGVQVDDKNRTIGAVDFNEKYGNLKAKAINDDEKIYLTFHGETEQSSKPTKRLSSYNAAVGDVVVVQNINNSYVITGKVV